MYMIGFFSPIPFQTIKQFPETHSSSPGIARWSLRRLELQRAITFNLCVVGKIRGYRCVCLVEGFVVVLSICQSDLRNFVNRWILSWLRQGSSSPVSFSIVVQKSSLFCSSCAQPLLPHLTRWSLQYSGHQCNNPTVWTPLGREKNQVEPKTIESLVYALLDNQI
jgi:hypothetical protein